MSAPSMVTSSDLEARIGKLSDARRRALASLVERVTESGSGAARLRAPGLVAFVAVAEGSLGKPPTAAELRDHVEQHLPRHMVPSSFHAVGEIPRLPNGKIDALALARVQPEEAEPGLDQVSPRNEVEEKLAAIWCDVLQIDEISVHDPFFELGGDSILSIHVTSRANQEGLGLSPNDIFNFPTVAELAARCSSSAASVSQAEPARPAVAPSSSAEEPVRRPPLFMVHWSGDVATRLRKYLGSEQPLFCFSSHFSSSADLEATATVEEMAEECLTELYTLRSEGPYYIGGYSMGGLIALEMARRLRRQGREVRMLFVLAPTPVPPRFGGNAHSSGDRGSEEGMPLQRPERTLRQKLSNQVEALRSVPSSERLRHMKSEAVLQFRYRVVEPLKLAVSTGLRRIGVGVPAALRPQQYVRMVYTHAWEHYSYEGYVGDMVIFDARDEASAETVDFWRSLARGEVHVETFDGGHLDFTQDPDLFDRWAKRLVTILSERQPETVQAG